MSSPSPSQTCWAADPFPIILDPIKYNFPSIFTCPWEQWSAIFACICSCFCCMAILLLS